MVPKDRYALEREYKRCIAKKAFVHIPKEAHSEYIKEAYSDISSAEKEVSSSPKWAIVKAYQALFLMSNAILIRALGIYSKDHSCVLIALMKENLIPKEILERISTVLKTKKKSENFFEAVSDIRVARNKYLYIPETQRKLNLPVSEIVSEIKELIKLLGEIE